MLKFAGAIAILAYLDVPLTLMIVAIIPLAVIYALHFSGRMNIALTQSKRQVGAINERVEDSLAGIRVVKSFANEDVENRRFEAENLKFLDTRRAGYKSEAFFSVGTTTFAQLITVVVIVVGAIRVQQAQLSVADMLTFLLCVASGRPRRRSRARRRGNTCRQRRGHGPCRRGQGRSRGPGRSRR